MLPDQTKTTFWPMLAIWASIWLLAPFVMLTAPMTAPTPIMMPSIVNKVRSLFRRRARPAILSVARILLIQLIERPDEHRATFAIHFVRPDGRPQERRSQCVHRA